MSFGQLWAATRITSADTLYFDLVNDWGEKRKKVILATQALPFLVDHFKNRRRTPYNGSSNLFIEDQFPRINLGFVCEGAVNAYYAMSEVAAQFGNRASIKPKLPASFNDIRQAVESGKLPELRDALGDLASYRKVREIRSVYLAELIGD